MSDFFQNGRIATLHNLGDRPLEAMEAELNEWAEKKPMCLVLPCLYSELQGPALENIIQELSKVTYLDEVIIGLDRATEEEFEHAKTFFSRLPQRHHILWNDGPRLKAIDKVLDEYGLAPNELGKGRNVWYCLGYALAQGRAKAVALHDCDILTYKRDIVAKLFYPVVHPTFNYAFCKGYYYRAANGKLNGRVSRLLVSPLVRALEKVFGRDDYLEFIDSFRYPLAGEFSMIMDVVSSIRIPSDWGLEIGVLSEVNRRYSDERVCQVDIADAYDHKHQDLSKDNPEGGLSKMSTDISKSLFRKLAIKGTVFTPEAFRTIKASYYRLALDLIDRYHNDAVINGMTLDRNQEENTVELFTKCIMRAGEQFLNDPTERPFMANWSRVLSAVPDVYDQLLEAVAQDRG
ncbi:MULTISPECIES: glycosyl transferase [unclassified Marinimicrobium]|jgi:glucosyl-3-phosphoglycerate synthase|uniref:glycosyl transferase n=1 Tax=unclassified Marinimicrobium TaxID=2632100 RepID=UPI000C39505F|nr:MULTISPECIES: glycosyl transferase [unclassified Marinimicrobium]MAN50922.1 glycosyl transferase [Marinimicrobium sp.]|tara:strand:+ start:289 stop:1500 length:1212 start_codon:yes stop_codon:yes gene_type:complete